MARTKRSFVVPMLLVGIPTGLAFAWGLSWAAGDYKECGEGTYFLADLGWVFGGMLLGLIVGIIVPVILAARGSFLLAIPVVLAAGVGMFLAGNAGAAIAPPLVGCTAWDTRGAGSMTTLGLAIGAVPTILIAGAIVGLREVVRHRRASRDGAGPPSGPADPRAQPLASPGQQPVVRPAPADAQVHDHRHWSSGHPREHARSMDGWSDRFKKWWKQGNAMAMLTGERGLDEVRDERASEPGPAPGDTESDEAHPGDDPRNRRADGDPDDRAAGGQDVSGAVP